MVDLIPPPETVMGILAKTGAYRKGHFVYPNGKHASHYFQIALVRESGSEVIGIGSIAKFDDAPNEFDGVPAKSLLSFDVNFYDTEEEWKQSRSASESEEQAVRF